MSFTEERSKYLPCSREMDILIPSLYEYFRLDDERSRRRANISKQIMIRLNSLGFPHWKKPRTVRMWFNNNKDKYLSTGSNPPTEFQTNAEIITNRAQSEIIMSNPMQIPFHLRNPTPNIAKPPILVINNNIDRQDSDDNIILTPSTPSTTTSAKPKEKIKSYRSARLVSDPNCKTPLPSNQSSESSKTTPIEEKAIKQENEKIDQGNEKNEKQEELEKNESNSTEAQTTTANLLEKTDSTQPPIVFSPHTNLPPLSPNLPDLFALSPSTNSPDILNLLSNLQSRTTTSPLVPIDQAIQTLQIGNSAMGTPFEPGFNESNTPPSISENLNTDVPNTIPSSSEQTPVVINFNKSKEKNQTKEKIQSKEKNQTKEKDKPEFDYSDKTNLTSLDFNREKKKCRDHMDELLADALNTSKIEQQQERLDAQIKISQEVEKLRDYANKNLFYTRGKFPSKKGNVPLISPKPQRFDRTQSTATRENQLPKNDGSSEQNPFVGTVVSYLISPTNFDDDQKLFLKGDLTFDSFMENNIECICPYDSGVFYVKSEKSYSTLIKASFENHNKEIICGTKTGFFTPVITITYIQEFDIVLLLGDKRIKAFNANDLSPRKVFALDDFYLEAHMEFFNNYIYVSCANESKHNVFVFDINSEEPSTEVEIHEDIIREFSIDPKYVNGSSGAPPIKQFPTDFYPNFLKRCGDYLGVSFADKTYVSIVDLEFNEISRLVGHSESIVFLDAINTESIISCSKDKGIRIWDLKTNENTLYIGPFSSPASSVESVTARNLPVLFVATSDGFVRCYSLSLNKETFVLTNETGEYNFIHFANDILIMAQQIGDSDQFPKKYRISIAYFNKSG